MSYSASASLVINASPERVWEALTLPEQVKEYFFGTDLVTDWQIGQPIYFRGEWQGKKYEDKGTVLEFEKPLSLSYNYWSSMSGIADQSDLYQILRYTLEPEADATRVTITQSNVATQDSADHSAQNWQGVLEALKKFLEK